MLPSIIQKAYAAGGIGGQTQTSAPGSVDHLLSNIVNQIVTPIIYLLVVLAVVYFVWGVFEFIRHADSPEERAKGLQHMFWGIIGAFIMVSAKGIINIILATLGLS